MPGQRLTTDTFSKEWGKHQSTLAPNDSNLPSGDFRVDEGSGKCEINTRNIGARLILFYKQDFLLWSIFSITCCYTL